MNIALYFAGLSLFLLGLGIGIAIMVTIDYQWWKSRKKRYDILRNSDRNGGCSSLDA